MASHENGELDPTNTGTGEENLVAARKKRLRRVSFADVEITSVHIFKRDEDYSDSTPPSDPKPDEETGKLTGNDGLVLFGDLGDHSDDFKELSCDREDEKEDDCGEEFVGRAPFFRPMESLSPGSSTVGSAVSNDEDNFFGPVQADFIKSGRLSDSGFPDENHDITMDSTAFSMHYRSLARSELGELKTPSRMGLVSAEKTLTDDVSDANQGSSMVMTNDGKLILESLLLHDDSRSGGKDSNEMSLVGDDPHRYDYGRLSPTLDALLAEGSEDLRHASLQHLVDPISTSIFDENASGQKDLIGVEDEEIGSTHDINEMITAASVDVQEANIMSIQHVMKDVSNRHDWSANASDPINTLEQPINGIKAIKTEVEVDGLNIEFSSITGDTRKGDGGKFLDLDVTALQGPTYGSSTEEYLKENFTRNNSNSVAKSGRMTGSPLADSVSSISAKRCEIFSHAATSPAHFLNLTPLPARSATSSSKESAKRGVDLSSIQRSISKFRSLDTSPTMPALKNGIETLKLKISNYLSANSPRYVAHVESSIDVLSKGAHAPVAQLESFGDDLKIVDWKCMPVVDSSEIPKPHNIEKVHRQNQITLAVEPGEPHDDIYTCTPGNKPTRDVTVMALSPNKFSLMGPASADFLQSALHGYEVGSSLMNLALHQRKDCGDACIPSELLISPMREANQNSSTENFYQKDVSVELNQQNHFNEFNVVNSEGNETSQGTITPDGYLTRNTDKLQSISLMEGDNLKSSISEYYQADNSVELNKQHQLNRFTGINTEENLAYPEMIKSDGSSDSDKLQSISSGTKAKDGDNLDLLHCPLKKPAEIPMRVKSTQSPCQRELSNFLPADSARLLPREEIASSPSKINCIQDSYYSEGQSAADGHIESTSRKRRSEEVVLGDEYRTIKVCRTKRSMEKEKSEGHGFAGCLEPLNETQKHGSDELQDWKDVLTKFSQDTETVLSPLPDQLDLRGIDMFEEILDYLQKARSYVTLSSEVQSKLGNASHKRSAETLLLLQKLVYEKARLKLNLERRDRLQKIAQNLSAGIEESQKLRHIYKERVSLSVERGNQLDCDCHHCPGNLKLKNAGDDTVILMRQQLEGLDQRVRSLGNSLLACCKTRGQWSCTSDTALLEESLKKRIYCRIVRQHLQPWEIVDFESSNNHRKFSLNYLGFIHQSISVTTNPISGLNVSNILQDVKINKTFPNMDACTAFTYVFNGEAAEKMVSSRSLAQKTQATISLLQNLLEVVEEVQQARLEIKNLICTTFHPPSGRRLDLLLSFIDLNSNQKMTITLDMTCLNRGIYPSEVLPDLAKVETNGMHQSLATEIRAAASCLPGGQQRIMRLCRCISNTVQSLSN